MLCGTKEKLTKLTVIGLACILWNIPSLAEVAPFRVVLDEVTFPPQTYSLMQGTADKVANLVEQLIPAREGSDVVLCFVAPAGWHAPITIVGAPLPNEPAASAQHPLRVAVSWDVLPTDQQKFVFQLAHELAHIKMDPRFDNDMVETFAVAVSFEVLARLGYVHYLQAAVETLTAPLPSAVKAALQNGTWSEVSSYLASRRQYHEEHPFDYSLAAAGAVLIRSSRDLPWKELLAIAEKNTCSADERTNRFQLCPLDESKLPQLAPVFLSLGRRRNSDTLMTSAGDHWP